MKSKTLSIDARELWRGRDTRLTAWLARVGSAGNPCSPPELISLSGLERIVFGRCEDPSEQGAASLQPGVRMIRVLDPWMSSAHAEIARTPSGFELRDLGSSNGTRVFGQRRSAAPLFDGDVFETGGSFWLFRHRTIEDGLPDRSRTGLIETLYPPLAQLSERVARVARTRVPVLLLGATGTGKEVLARAIHRASERSGHFVAINAAAIPSTLVVSELFGVERGAHSMADASRVGQVRAAEGGTCLLDELGDASPEVQVALLRLLQEAEILPVGSSKPIKVDVRFIFATNRKLGALASMNGFREDLLGRIKGCTLELPSLSERREDIGWLIGRFLERYCGERLSFSVAAYRALVNHPWPLNIRELEKTIETAVALTPDRTIDVDQLPSEILKDAGSVEKACAAPLSDGIAGASRSSPALEEELPRMLRIHGGNLTRVARSMGTTRQQIHRWLKRLNLDVTDYRARRQGHG